MQEDDHLLKDALSNLAPTVDAGGVWNALHAQVAKRRQARRRRLKLAGATAVVVVALGLGAFGAIHWWPHHESILLITDDQTGAATGETSQVPTEPDSGWQQLSLPQSGSPYFYYVMMDPTDPDVLYAGTDVGLFVSRDAASSWTQLCADNLETLAIDPGPPAALYGATRDEKGYPHLQKSVDGGATWKQLTGLPEDSQGSFWLDTSTSPSTVYVSSMAEPHGLLKSTDGGDTWQGLGIGPSFELVSPPSGSVLFAQGFNTGPLEFLRSSDGGATWEDIRPAFPDVVPNGMSVDPRDPSRRLYIYAVDPDLAPESIADPGIVVFVSPDAGRTWSRADGDEQEWAKILPFAAPGTPPAAISGAAPFLADFAAISEAAPSLDGKPPTVTDSATGASLYVSGSVVIDPSDSSLLYVAASANQGVGGIYKSNDQGATWTNTTAATIKTDSYVDTMVVDSTDPDTIYAITGGSVLRSTDAGASWTTLSGGLANGGAVLAVAPSSPSTLYLLTQTGLSRSDDGGETWTDGAGAELPAEVTSGELGGLLVAPDSPETLLALTYDEIYRSSNGGLDWSKVAVVPAGTIMQWEGERKRMPLNFYWGPFRNDLVVAVLDEPSTFYALLADDYQDITPALSRSTDDGQTWTQLDSSLEDDGHRYSPLALDPHDPLTVYARRSVWDPQAGFGPADQGIWRSDDGGNTWSQLASEGLPESDSQSLFVDPWASGTLYTAGDWTDPEETTGTIYRSTDRGDSWQDIGDLQLPAVGGYLTRLVPAPGGVLYAVGPRGIFKWVPQPD
jgi:photosystem II stability/assembly factor-like uncharacterized protein